MRKLAVAFVLLVAGMAGAAPTLAAAGFRGVQLDPAVAEFYSDYFAEQLRAAGLSVITPSDTATLLGFERQKQLLGCSEDSSSCVAEIAGGLGVNGIVSGSLARLGDAYTVQVKILSATDGRPLWSAAGRLATDEALHAWFREEARAAATHLGVSSSAGSRKFWIPLAVGAGAAATSGVSFVLASQTLARVKTSSYASETDLRRDANLGATEQWVSRIALGAGVVSLALAAVLYATEPKVDSSIDVAPINGGAAASFTTRF